MHNAAAVPAVNVFPLTEHPDDSEANTTELVDPPPDAVSVMVDPAVNVAGNIKPEIACGVSVVWPDVTWNDWLT